MSKPELTEEEKRLAEALAEHFVELMCTFYTWFFRHVLKPILEWRIQQSFYLYRLMKEREGEGWAERAKQ